MWSFKIIIKHIFQIKLNRTLEMQQLIRKFLLAKKGWRRTKISYYLEKHGVYISQEALVPPSTFFPHPYNIFIGKGVKIGERCSIYQNVTIGANHNKYPVLGDNCIVFPASTIVGNIEIGDNVVVGANSFVNKSFQSNSIIGGSPAKIINKL